MFDGVVQDAHNRSDFRKADHFPQAACMKEMQGDNFEKPSHTRKKEAAGSEHHQALVDTAAATKIEGRSNEKNESQATPKVQSERANAQDRQ